MKPPGGYRRARQVAASPEASERAALAQESGLAPEILYYLAQDGSLAVRQAVAANAEAPPQADRLLAGDMDPAVRCVLGRKLARLAPGLSAATQDRMLQMGWETLCGLVEDTAATVRAAIADVLAGMPDAPRELILRLAQDVEMPVAEPVIRLSPLLTEQDLLALVNHPPVQETLTAVARRPDLSETLCDAILAHADPGTVTALLANPSAAIREATLDSLIANASRHAEWHDPLVRRPRLSAQAARAMAEIVATHLLALLAARADLDPLVTEDLRLRLAQRLDTLEASHSPEEAFQEAARLGDRPAMQHLLAAACDVPVDIVRRAISLRSAKAFCSLCWHAGFTTASLAAAQNMLGQLPPGQALVPLPGGRWPLAPDEMNWQLELLTNMEG